MLQWSVLSRAEISGWTRCNTRATYHLACQAAEDPERDGSTCMRVLPLFVLCVSSWYASTTSSAETFSGENRRDADV